MIFDTSISYARLLANVILSAEKRHPSWNCITYKVPKSFQQALRLMWTIFKSKKVKKFQQTHREIFPPQTAMQGSNTSN